MQITEKVERDLDAYRRVLQERLDELYRLTEGVSNILEAARETKAELLFAVFRNKLDVYPWSRAFEPTFIWSREVNPDGAGEHIHVLLHMPSKHKSNFENVVLGCGPGAGEMDVRRADHRTHSTSNGKRVSAVACLSKQMTSRAWYRRGLIRRPGGAILGKRGGTTRNLNRRAREAFRASRPRFETKLKGIHGL